MQNKLKNLFLAAASIVGTLIVAEVVLAHFLPFGFSEIGHQYAENAKRYGWGFRPDETVRITDPDTGVVYTDRLNDKGWRDRHHDFDNSEHTFRILVLGDSNTYGAIVPVDNLYTRVLEKRLTDAGFRAEVISLAYEGWGTDQQLEALEHEGVRYHPDLVILQFTTNDLEDNDYFHASTGNARCTKPFYYELDGAGQLVKHENPCFAGNSKGGWRQKVKALISKSEILKRLYSLRGHSVQVSTATAHEKYAVTAVRVAHLQAVLKLSGRDDLIGWLHGRLDKPLPAEQLDAAIERYHVENSASVIRRVLENRPFQEYWSEADYRPAAPDSTSAQWQLYFALAERVGELVQKTGARMALFSDNGVGQMQWERYWHRLASDDTSQANYLAPSLLLRQFALHHSIDYIDDSDRHHQRGRNDPHPNSQGNRAMAENIYAYVTHAFSQELEQFRMKKSDLTLARGRP